MDIDNGDDDDKAPPPPPPSSSEPRWLPSCRVPVSDKDTVFSLDWRPVVEGGAAKVPPQPAMLVVGGADNTISILTEDKRIRSRPCGLFLCITIV